MRPFDIVYLQETHSTPRDEIIFSSEWRGINYWNHCDSRTAGTAILFSENFVPTISQVFRDVSGRMLTVVIESDDQTSYVLSNVYAPAGGTNKTARKDFFSSVENTLKDLRPNNYILGGDFNCVLDNSLDRSTPPAANSDASKATLTHLIRELHCEDIWRLHHPDEKVFTHRSHFGTAVRIDRFYTSRVFRHAIISSDISPCPHTDHDLITASFVFEPVILGKSTWYFNCSLLSDNSFQQLIENFWINWRDAKTNFSDLATWWDRAKEQIKELSRNYSANKFRSQQKELKDRKKKLRNAQRKSDLTGEACHKRLTAELQNHVRRIEQQLAEGAKIRSKAAHLVHNETCSKYFFNLEKKRGEDKLIRAVQSSNSGLISEPAAMRAEIKSFYESLYRAEPCDKAIQAQLLTKIDQQISEDQNTALTQPFTRQDLKKSIEQMANSKSPGLDGLPAEFYKHFFDLIADDLLLVFNELLTSGRMSASQRTGLITLLYKKGDRTDLKNWRPISLLNCDYKILAKMISLRLANVLENIIQPDQTCSVPNRSIITNGLLLRDLVQIAEEKNIPAALISLDQLKAFDRVNWDFLFQTMSAFNFHPTFISWIKLLYTDIFSCVRVNGHLTETFSLTRGVRQGCPLSPLLYVIVAEVFAISIRQNSNIQGIPIPPRATNKISQYADDTTLTVVGDKSIDEVFSTVTLFEQASGARINLQKCEGLWLGSNKGRLDRPHNIRWSSGKIKIIGYYFGNIDISHDNWDEKIVKFKKTLNLWKIRNLSLRGRSLILSQLAASKLWYTAAIYPLPLWAEKQLTEAIWDFFNNGHPQQVKRSLCELPRDLGGLSIPNIPLKVQALQAMWIHKLLHLPDANWKACVLYNFDKYFNLNLGLDILNIKAYKPGFKSLPKFYRTLLDTWFLLRGQRACSPKTRGDILMEPILYSHQIRDPVTHLPFWYPECARANIVRLSDISYVVIPGLLPLDAICELFTPHMTKKRVQNFYHKLLLSLPADWLSLLNSDSPHTPSPDRDSFIILSSLNTRVPTHKLTTKRVYLELQRLSEIPTKRFQKWNSVIPNIHWRSVWQHCYDSFSENKFCDTHWRLLHRSLPLAPGLYKRNHSPTPYCSLCSHNKNETLTHLFFECDTVQPLLRQTEQFITHITGSPFTLTLKHIVTNFFDNRNQLSNRICNYLLNITRYTIWTVRNIQRHEHRSVNLQNFARLLIKERLNIEHFLYLYTYKDLDSFSRSWAVNSVLCSLDGDNLVHLL